MVKLKQQEKEGMTMVDFEDRVETREEKEKRLFEESWTKQIKRTKKILCTMFLALGSVFLAVGIAMFCFKSYDNELVIAAMVFSGLGLLYMILSLIFKKAIPEKANYEKYKKQHEKYGYQDYNMLAIKLDVLEKRIKELEQKLDEKENSGRF